MCGVGSFKEFGNTGGRMKCNGTQHSGPRHDEEDLEQKLVASRNKKRLSSDLCVNLRNCLPTINKDPLWFCSPPR
jgi:hypothetical protein